MSPRLRKLGLTLHVITSVGWLGAVTSFLALALAGLLHQEVQVVRGAYLAMDVTARFVIVPLCIASLVTGVLQALGTTWGLFRHYWVIVKFVLTLPATIILLVHMRPIRHLAVSAAMMPLGGDLYGMRLQLIVNAAAALVVLLVTTTLSVYKPRGMTRYGQRKLRTQRGIVQQ